METLKVDSTDVILQDLEKLGQGKIIIADNWRGAFTCSWGAMGSNIKQFICRINESYFADKLCAKTYEFDGKLTARNIRKHIREGGELPYWKFMSAQKELRKKIKEVESCSNENEFVSMCYNLSDGLMCYDLSWDEEKEFKAIVTDIFSQEPWGFIGEKVTAEYKWLCKLHKSLKSQIKHSC